MAIGVGAACQYGSEAIVFLFEERYGVGIIGKARKDFEMRLWLQVFSTAVVGKGRHHWLKEPH